MKPFANPFDDIQDHEWNTTTTPNSSYKASTASPFDDIADEEWQDEVSPTRTASNRFSLGATVRGFAPIADNIVTGFESVLPDSKGFFDAAKGAASQRFDFSPARQQGDFPGGYDLEAQKRLGTMAGVGDVADAIINFLPGITQQALNIPAKDRWKSQIGNWIIDEARRDLDVDAIYNSSPETINTARSLSSVLVPLPGRAAELLGDAARYGPRAAKYLNPLVNTVGGRITDAALTQGALGAGQAVNQRMQKNEAFDAGDLFGAFAGGSLLGAGFHGAGELAGATLNRLGGAIKAGAGAWSKFDKPTKPGRVLQTRTIGQIDADFLDDDEKAILQALQLPGKKSDNVGGFQSAIARKTDRVAEAIGAIETASPIALKDRIKEAKAAINEHFGAFDKPGKLAAMQKVEEAIKLNADWQLVEGQLRQPSERLVPGERGSRVQPYPYHERYAGATGLEEAAPIGPEKTLPFPDYLDLSTAEPTKWSMRDYLDVNQSPDGLRFPQYLDFAQEPKSMGQLSEELGALPAPDVKLSPFQMALAKVKNASEADLDAAIAEASKAIPKGAPKDYRKQLKAQLNEAYKENLVRRGIEPEQVGARPSEPEQVPLTGQGSVFDDIQPEEWQAKPVNYTPKRRLTASEEMELKQKELQLFPMHDAGWLKENRGRGNGFSLRLSHKEMPDAELDQFIAFTEGTTKMRSNSVAERRRASAELKAALDEKMRREYRRAQNLPEDWAGGVEDMRWHSEEKLADIASGPEEDPRTQEAAHELMRRAQEPAKIEATNEPATQTNKPAQGEFRQRLNIAADGRAMRGHNQGALGRHIDDFDEAILPSSGKALIEQHAQNKIAKDVAEYRLEEYAKAVYEKFGDGRNKLKLGKLAINPPKQEDMLTLEGQALKAKVRQEYADFVTDGKGSTLRAIAANPASQYIPKPMAPDTLEEAAPVLAALKETAKQAAKDYDNLKGDVSKVANEAKNRLRLNDPQSSFAASVPVELPDGRVISVKVEAKSERLEMEFAAEAFERAKAKNPELLPEVFYANWELARAEKTGLQPRPAAVVMAEAASNLAKYKDALKEIQSKFGYSRTVPGSVVRSANALLPAATGISAGIEGGGAAMAADGEEGESKTDMPVTAALATLTAAGLGVKVIRKVGIERVGEFLGSKLGFLANMYRDTVDHLAILDKALGSKAGEGMAAEVWAHSAAIVRSSWGVTFPSPTHKAHALSLLRNKRISLQDALDGATGTTFEELTPEARKAVVESYLQAKTLLGKLKQAQQRIDALAEAGQIDGNKLKESRRALAFAIESLQPNRDSGTIIGDGFSYTASNAMSAIFEYNPSQYLLNLSDQFIAGGSKVGLGRMAAANALLIADRELAGLFSGSNLTANFQSERIEQSIRSRSLASGGRNPIEIGASSDRVNADRVVLGSMLEFFDDNKGALQYGTGADFAKALLKGEVSEDIAMQAWVKAIDDSSRTLGVDPLRLNTDAFTRFKHAPVLTAFIRQPARLARLAKNYIRDGEYGKLLTLVGVTAAVGGSAAMPEEVKRAWQSVNPAQYFAVSKALDELNVARRLTGFDFSAKVGYGFLPILFAATTPALETLKAAPEKVEKVQEELIALEKVGNGDVVRLWQDPTKNKEKQELVRSLTGLAGSLVLLAKAKVFGVPLMPLVNIAKAKQQEDAGTMPVWMYEPGSQKAFASRKDIPLEKMRYGKATPYLDVLMPGQPVEVRDTFMSELEKSKRKKKRQSTNASDLSYQDPIKAMAR